MKLSEIHNPNVIDQELADDEARSTLNFSSMVSFTHEKSAAEAFQQLMKLPQFKAQLEHRLQAAVNAAINDMMSSSSIPPGYGWTGDYVVDVTVNE